MFDYEISIKGNGGEFCIGSISDAAASYWSKVSKSEFTSYLCNPDGHRLEPNDESLQLEKWHDLNNVVWVYGIEGLETLTIKDPKNRTIYKIAGEPRDDTPVYENDSIIERAKPYNGKPVVFSRSHEKGHCILNLSTEEPFNPVRLAFQKSEIAGHSLITSIQYDGEDLPMEESFPKAYADNEAKVGTLRNLSVD